MFWIRRALLPHSEGLVVSQPVDPQGEMVQGHRPQGRIGLMELVEIGGRISRDSLPQWSVAAVLVSVIHLV